MRRICESRGFVSFVIGCAVAIFGYSYYPFTGANPVLALIGLLQPDIERGLYFSYRLLWILTPFWICFITLSGIDIYLLKGHPRSVKGDLPAYPDPATRQELFLVVGEQHRQLSPKPAQRPGWLVVPEKGLFTGVVVFGATGTGKTTCCMRPFAQQLLSYRADDPKRKLSGLVLEVKGDFCHQVKQILEGQGRGGDYLELNLEGDYRYNPLYNDLEAYALAYAIASLLINLYGRGKEPFWQQAYSNLVKFVILLHKVVDDYVTLFDVYHCVISPDHLQKKIDQGKKQLLGLSELVVSCDDYGQQDQLAAFNWRKEGATMRAPSSQELIQALEKAQVKYKQAGIEPSEKDADRRERFIAVVRWFDNDWKAIDNKLRTSIVEGISVFLSLFDDNPAVKRVFCPPKECYDKQKNRDGRYGKPLPPFSKLIEQGKVVALNFPVSGNPGLARAVGVFLKQDFQRALMSRIPKMASQPDRHWREVLFLCDEYHSFATVGEDNPTGDEKFFALSRQARCIPIVATQSISSLRSTLHGEAWRTLLQAFRTKIFLALSDDFSARVASDLCGHDEQLREYSSLSESGQDAKVSLLGGASVASRSTVSTSKGYHWTRLPVFEAKVFTELKNAQAIVLAYDGFNPWPPTYCYLKPYYLDPDTSYFEQLERGAI